MSLSLWAIFGVVCMTPNVLIVLVFFITSMTAKPIVVVPGSIHNIIAMSSLYKKDKIQKTKYRMFISDA